MKRVLYLATRPRRRTAYFVAVAIVAFLLTSCARGVSDARPNAAIVSPAVGLAADSSTAQLPDIDVVQSTQKPGLLRRLFPAKSTAVASSTLPRKCKGCQFVIQNGNHNTADQASIDKNKAAAVLASPAATQSNAAENSQQQNVQGDGNDLTAKQSNPQTETKPGFWGALLGNPVGQIGLGVIGLFIAGSVVYGFVLWRKKKQAQALMS